MAGEISLPGMGGLTRFNEEYKSKLRITPVQVILGIVVVILFVLSLKIFLPVN